MKKGFRTLNSLVIRNMKIFSRDKLTVFLSMLSSIIILLLFVLFLKNVQVEGIKEMINAAGVTNISGKHIEGIVNGWFLSGVLAVSAISVGLTFYATMIRDKESKINNDFTSSPTHKNLIKSSYFISSFIVNIMINLILLAIGLIYLVATGTFYLGFADVLMLLVNLVISCLSASAIMLLISSIFTKESQFGSFTGILSGMSGFVIGAYMPISAFPKAIQYIVGFIPGSYSANVFRNIFLVPAIDKISGEAGAEATKAIADYFGLSVNFCGVEIGYGMSFLFLAVSILLAGVIAFFVFKYGKRFTIKKLSKKNTQKSDKGLTI